MKKTSPVKSPAILLVVNAERNYVHSRGLDSKAVEKALYRISSIIDENIAAGNDLVYILPASSAQSVQESSYYQIMRFGKPILYTTTTAAAYLDTRLPRNDYKEISVVGFSTEAILANAFVLQAVYPEATICVYSGCCVGENHNAAIRILASCGVKII